MPASRPSGSCGRPDSPVNPQPGAMEQFSSNDAMASIYSATKAAVISLGRTLAVELAQRGVRVNVLSPGPIDTPISKKSSLPPDQAKGVVEMLGARSLLKRIGTSDEVARAARFLLSEDSSNITGTELIIDGGVRLARAAS